MKHYQRDFSDRNLKFFSSSPIKYFQIQESSMIDGNENFITQKIERNWWDLRSKRNARTDLWKLKNSDSSDFRTKLKHSFNFFWV